MINIDIYTLNVKYVMSNSNVTGVYYSTYNPNMFHQTCSSIIRVPNKNTNDMELHEFKHILLSVNEISTLALTETQLKKIFFLNFGC